MLDEITASNLGLIEQARLRLGAGLTVITGETGAGKTLMLGALRLIRGDKAGKGYIGPAGDSCEVAVRFAEGEEEIVIRRSVDATRSRAYINDSATTVAALVDAIGTDVAIVGQHDQLTITTTAGVRSLLDRSLSPAGRDAKAAYDAAWAAHQAIEKELAAIGSDIRGLERDRDMLRFQIDEIDTAAVGDDEEAEIRSALVRLRNAEALGHDVDAALTALGDEGLERRFQSALAAVSAAAKLDPSLDPVAERLEALVAEANDIAGELAVYATSTDLDPQALDDLESRLALVNSIKRKYGDTVEDVITFRKDAGARELELTELLDAATDIDERRARSLEELRIAGADLRDARQSAGQKIAKGAMTHLVDLGFAEPVVGIEVTASDPGANGADRATILFASDVGLAPGPVSAIASGGELSRLVLALTLAAGAADAAVVAFDEIDAGVGGTTALAMGEKLAQLAADRQVVCVTHLPQVAAFADSHFAVRRTGQTAHIEHIDGAHRLTELTRMLAGLSESERGREHAEELLALAGQADT